MQLKRLAAALLLVSVGLTGCSDDPEPSNNGTNNGAADATITPQDDAGDAGPTTDDASVDAEPDADPTEDDTGLPSQDAGEDIVEQDDAGDVGQDAEVCDESSGDCDFDDLYDCEERQLGTDVCNPDTDGDGLSDGVEVGLGTDPLDPDTDGDGVDDYLEEEVYGLDPLVRDTFGDGTDDGDRWVTQACASPSAEPVDFHDANGPGNWKLALPPTFANYTELTVAGADVSNRKGLAVYDDPTNEVAGALVSALPRGGQGNPNAALRSHRTSIEGVGTIRQGFNDPEFATHDRYRAASARYLLEMNSAVSTTELRDSLMFALAPFPQSDVTGLPAASGATYTKFRVFVSVINRLYCDGQKHLVTTLSVAPAAKYDSRDRVKFRMNDLTNTTNLGEPQDEQLVNCELEGPKEAPATEFYWVLDHSGSMNAENAQVASVANQFFNRMSGAGLDYRLGVTSMEPDRDGRLRSAGWHTDLNTFINEVNWVIGLNGGSEPGIEVAKQGIEYMRGLTPQTPPQNQRIRPGAQVVTIWMSDEEEQTIKDAGGIGTSAAQQLIADYSNFFIQQSTSFAIVGDGGGCGSGDGESYRQVAQASGGSFASVCAQDLSETIDEIIFSTAASVGYELDQTPISSTLRVFVNGEWVPRNRENGFDYFAQTNSIVFFGRYRPELPQGNEEPDRIAVNYETFDLRRKPGPHCPQ